MKSKGYEPEMVGVGEDMLEFEKRLLIVLFVVLVLVLVLVLVWLVSVLRRISWSSLRSGY